MNKTAPSSEILFSHGTSLTDKARIRSSLHTQWLFILPWSASFWLCFCIRVLLWQLRVVRLEHPCSAVLVTSVCIELHIIPRLGDKARGLGRGSAQWETANRGCSVNQSWARPSLYLATSPSPWDWPAMVSTVRIKPLSWRKAPSLTSKTLPISPGTQDACRILLSRSWSCCLPLRVA